MGVLTSMCFFLPRETSLALFSHFQAAFPSFIGRLVRLYTLQYEKSALKSD